MIKKIFSFTISFFFFVTLLSAQKDKTDNNFVLNGSIKGVASGTIYLSRYDFALRKPFRDSAQFVNGKFQFKGFVSEPTEFDISLVRDASSVNTNYKATLFIEPAKMNIILEKDYFDKAKVTGSVTQLELDELNRKKFDILQELRPLSENSQRTNNEYIAAIRRTKNEDTLQYYKDIAVAAKDAMEPYVTQLNKIDLAFIKSHPASYVTASMMRWKTGSMSVSEIEAIYNNFPVEIQKSSYGIYIQNQLDELREGSPGATAYNFITKDINGDALSLSDFRGKYVLLDFWASWCVPCRKGNPHLISLYEKYNKQGFEIIGISDDDSKPEAWKKAVEEDGIDIWRHVLRGVNVAKAQAGKGTGDDDINDDYAIHTLPTKILIDPNGRIIGRYGGGGENDEALDKKLAEIFEPIVKTLKFRKE